MNPYVWFGDRLVSPIPRHFVKTSTPLSEDSREWVLTSLKGRYGTVDNENPDMNSLSLDWKTYIYFEDSAEAMIYELRWSGNN